MRKAKFFCGAKNETAESEVNGCMQQLLQNILWAFVLAAFAGCSNPDFFQAEIYVYSVGWGEDSLVRVDKSGISVFDDGDGANMLLEIEITKEKVDEIRAALHGIPFSEMKRDYVPDFADGGFIDDGVGMAISVRLAPDSWGTIVQMENCRLKEVEEFVLIIHDMIAESGSDLDGVLAYLSMPWTNEIFPKCK